MTRTIYVYENPENGEIIESPCEIIGWTPVRTYDIVYPDPGSGGGGVSNYDQLSGKPQINGVTLSGNKTAADLGIDTYDDTELSARVTANETAIEDRYTKAQTDTLLANKAAQSSVVALQNTAEDLRLANEATQEELTQFKDDYVIDMAGKQTMAVINWQYEFFYAELLEMLKCGGAVIEWGDQTYMPVVGFEDTVVEGTRTINAFVNNTASIDGITSLWFTWSVADADKESVKMTPNSYFHSVTAVGVPWVAAQLADKADKATLSNYYTKSETNAYVSSQVTPKAEVEINKSSNAMDIVGGGRYASFNVNTDGDMEMMLAEPGTYLKTATVPSKTNMNNAISAGVTEAKAYTDNKTLAASGWGVVRTGVATVTFNNSRWSSSATVDVSEFGFSSGADYDVVAQPTTGGTATPWGNAIAFVNADKGASSFSVSSVTMEESLSGTVNIKYTIFAKGYGAVAYTGEIPTGGTAGQILTKRSDADGDYGWQNKLPSYAVDKPEGSNPVLGNVVQVGSFVNTDGTEYGIYEFYYKTSALPAVDATKTYSFSPLLDDFTIFDFIDQSGITSNGHVISSGRTDGTNRIIIQQFSKNNKNVMLRAYGDYTAQTALLRIKFIGTKNNA